MFLILLHADNGWKYKPQSVITDSMLYNTLSGDGMTGHEGHLYKSLYFMRFLVLLKVTFTYTAQTRVASTNVALPSLKVTIGTKSQRVGKSNDLFRLE